MKGLKKFIKRFFIFIGVTFVILLAGAYSVIWICINGPSWVAGDLFVLSVRETSAAGFLADIYCSDEKIREIEDRNKVEDTDEITDTSIIKVQPVIKDEDKNNQNNNQNDNNSGETDSDNKNKVIMEADGIRVEQVTGSTFRGAMMLIRDPSRVFVGTLDEYGDDKNGKTILQYIEDYGVSGGANGGEYQDVQGTGSGGYPMGIVISEGELKWGEPDTTYEVIGFNKENVLVVGNMTAKKAMDMGIRDAVSFGPILIVNGVPANMAGTGGGLNPRTAIGQRSDGTVLLLVIDGRQAASLGASMADVTNVMLEYGAVNAANLDGGSSTVLYYNGESLNTNASLIGMRKMPTAILIR